MQHIVKKPLLLFVVLMAALVIAACSNKKPIQNGDIPDIAETHTPVSHMTPTPVPAVNLDEPPPVDWSQTAHFAPAMREMYVSDIGDWVDGNRYYIEATVDFTETAAVINGVMRVRYANKSPHDLDKIGFRLYPNLPAYGGRMRVVDAQLDGESTPFDTIERNTTVTVPLKEHLQPGDSVELVLQFVMVAERGIAGSKYGHFGFQNDVLVAPEWYPTIAPYEVDSGWYLARKDSDFGDSVYSETALYEVYLTYPSDMTVVISGVSLDQHDNGDGTATQHVVSGPMRDSMLIMSPILRKITRDVNGTDVNVYYWPGDERGAVFALEVGTEAMRIFDEAFGDYPFAELDIVETFTISGVEFPGVIIINNNNWQPGNGNLELTIAHEVAHQWWYSVVGNDQLKHGWIDESLTSYSEGVYLRRRDESTERYLKWIRDNRRYYRQLPGVAMNTPLAGINNSFQIFVAYYAKGRVFYDTLEQRFGEALMLETLRNYYQDFKYQVAFPVDVLHQFEATTGEDLDAFFREWLGPFEGVDPDVEAEFDDSSIAS